MKNRLLKMTTRAIVALSVMIPGLAMAQQTSLSDVESEVNDLKDSAFNIIEVVIIIALAVGAIYVINQMISNPDQGKKFAVGWVVALIFYIIVFQVLN